MDNRNWVIKAMPFFITALMITVILFIELMRVGIADNVDYNEVLTKFIINCIIIVSMAITWSGSGSLRAKNQQGSPYSENVKRYSSEIDYIGKNGKLTALKIFCEEKTKEKLQIKSTKLLNSVSIDYNVYLNQLRSLSVEDLKKKRCTKKQIRIIEKIRKNKIKVKKINVMELMTDSSMSDEYDIHYNEYSASAKMLLYRIFKSALTAIILSLITIEPFQNITDLTYWTTFIMKLVTIIYTAFSAEKEGFKRIAETKNKVILKRLEFINLFKEWESAKGKMSSQA